MEPITLETLTKLGQFDTPTICNLIELFEVRPRNTGYMDARIQACFPEMPPMVGFAATATFRSAAPPRRSDVYDNLAAQVESFSDLSGPAVVVFQDLDDPTLNVMAALQQKVMLKAVLVYDAVEKQLPAISGLKLQGLNGQTQAHSLTHQDYVAYEAWASQYFETLRQKLSRVGVTLIEISTQDDLLNLHRHVGFVGAA